MLRAVESLADLGAWISNNEALLSGIAAMIVVGGVVFTPLGVGLRRLVRPQPTPEAPPLPSPAGTTPANSAAAAPSPAATAVTDKPSIAVLPFANMSADPEQEFLADGMTEDIITGLAASRHLFVVSRNSTFAYKGQAPDIRDVGRELGVRYVLEGSVRRVGEKVRTTVQLIETTSGSHIWAEKYDRPYAEMFDVQDEVVAHIGGALVAQLSSAEWERSAREAPANLGAWELVQRGVSATMAGIPCIESSGKSLEALRAAVELDPNYAYARAALAWMSFGAVINGWTNDVNGALRNGEKSLKAALDSSPAAQDPLVLFYLGAAYIYSGRHDRAIRVLETSLERNPNQPDVFMHLGIAHGYLGDYATAHANFDRAEQMSPTGGMSLGHRWYRAIVLCFEERYDEAIPLLEELLEQTPRYGTPRVVLALAYAATGRMDAARAAVERAERNDPGLSLEGLAINIRAHPDPERGREREALLRELWPAA